MRNLFLALLSVFILTGCGTKSSAVLSLHYTPHTQAEKSAKAPTIKVAIVKATYDLKVAATYMPQSAYASFFESRMEKALPTKYKVISRYNKNYIETLKDSFTSDVESILKNKGVNVVQRYNSMDEIPYSARKDIDLIVIPVINFAPVVQDKVTKIPLYVTTITSEKGEIQYMGRIELDFIEPVSKEKIIIKKIDIATRSAFYTDEDSGYDALTNLLSETYTEAMSRVDVMIDIEEIESELATIIRLKEKHQ